MKDPAYWERIESAATRALSRMGREAVSDLVRTLIENEDSEIRVVAANALAGMGTDAKGALKALTDTLRDESPEVRGAAASALRTVGPEAEAAVPVLLQALEDKSQDVRFRTAEALATIDTEVAKAGVAILVEMLQDKYDLNPRARACNALGKIGPGASEAIPALIETYLRADRALSRTARYALDRVAVDKRALAAAVTRFLDHEKPLIRERAKQLLAEFDSE